MTRTHHLRHTIVALAVGALVVAACQSEAARSKKTAEKAGAPVEAAPPVALPDSPAKGPATAPVMLVEVSDFQ